MKRLGFQQTLQGIRLQHSSLWNPLSTKLEASRQVGPGAIENLISLENNRVTHTHNASNTLYDHNNTNFKPHRLFGAEKFPRAKKIEDRLQNGQNNTRQACSKKKFIHVSRLCCKNRSLCGEFSPKICSKVKESSSSSSQEKN